MATLLTWWILRARQRAGGQRVGHVFTAEVGAMLEPLALLIGPLLAGLGMWAVVAFQRRLWP